MAFIPLSADIHSHSSVTWLAILVHLLGSIALLCAIVFIGLRYREVFQDPVRFPNTPLDLRPPRRRRARSTRAPHPSPTRFGTSSGLAPPGAVTHISSIDIHERLRLRLPRLEELPPDRPRYVLRRPASRRSISIGGVEEGRIAQRRRASDVIRT